MGMYNGPLLEKNPSCQRNPHTKRAQKHKVRKWWMVTSQGAEPE